MGGGTAIVLASRHPERVGLLVLVASLALSRHRGLGLPPRAFPLVAAGLSVPGLREWLVEKIREAYRKRRFPGAETLDAAGFAAQIRAIGAADYALMRRAVRGRCRPDPGLCRDDHMIETHVSEARPGRSPTPADGLREGGHTAEDTRTGAAAATSAPSS